WDTRAERQSYEPFVERYDCLSRNASRLLTTAFRPRAVFSGHTHRGCLTRHDEDVGATDVTDEWTIASFNYRYIRTPTLMLATFTKTGFAVRKCIMVDEMALYLADTLIVIVFALVWCRSSLYGQLYRKLK